MKEPRYTRRHHRIGVNLWISHESVASFRSDPAFDLSEGGVFIKTARPLPVGTIVYMDIYLREDQAEALHAVGEVVWHRGAHAKDEQPAGMGISFIQIDPESKTLLAAYISQHQEGA